MALYVPYDKKGQVGEYCRGNSKESDCAPENVCFRGRCYKQVAEGGSCLSRNKASTCASGLKCILAEGVSAKTVTGICRK